jgi:hypothetical protein
MKLHPYHAFLSLIFLMTILLSCKSSGIGTSATSDFNATDEISQQVGDAAASIDEMGGSTGSLAYLLLPTEREIKRYFGEEKKFLDFFISPAFAAGCRTAATFSDCSDNVRVRTFDNCTVGAARFDGTVTLTFDDLAVNDTCRMTADGHSITRAPDFTITGRSGGTFTVSKTGTDGQKLTKAGEGFLFTNDGIRRVFKNAANETVSDITTEIPDDDPILVVGDVRADRIMIDGTLRVTNNLTEEACEYTPTDVTYDADCNCPVSGSWSGTCGEDESSIEITGCGTATITRDNESKSVTFDRCYQTN